MAELRERIVDAALALLRESGERGLSTLQVAKRAGIPQGHLTYYFPRKADLVAAVARALQEETAADLVRIAKLELGDVRTAGIELLTALVMDADRSRALLGLTIEAQEDPEARAVLLEIVEHGRPLIAMLPGLEGDELLVDVIQSATWGLQLQQLFERRGRAHVRAVVERLLVALQPTPKKRRTKRGAS
jgi:AcrR family transcriptional regulator